MPLILGLFLIVSACVERGELDIEEASDSSSDPSGDPDATTESDGPDGETDEAPTPICELDTLELRTPEWVESLPKPGLGWEQVEGLVAGEQVFFVRGRHYVEGLLHGGFVEARGLDGSLDWRVETPEDSGHRLGWDGEHLYFGDKARRMSAEGVLDESWTGGAEFGYLTALNVSGEDVLIGTYQLGEDVPHETNPGLGFVESLSKDGEDGSIVEIGENQIVWQLMPWSGGGHIAAVGGAGFRLLGFEGAPYGGGAALGELNSRPRAAFLLEVEDGVLVVGYSEPYFDPASIWTRTLDVDGEVLRRTQVEACGVGVPSLGWNFARHGERIVGVAQVDVGGERLHSIVIELNLEGELVASYRVMGVDENTVVLGLAANEDVVIIAGHQIDDDATSNAWIARLE